MAKKKKGNTDAKSVAYLQKHEMEYICKVFFKDGEHLKVSQLKEIMLALGKNGKPSRSRRNIYIGIRAYGYVFVGRKRK